MTGQKFLQSFLIIPFFVCFSFQIVYGYSLSHHINDTTLKIWISTPSLEDDSTDKVAQYLLETDTIFKERWKNEFLYVYERADIENMPDSIWISLKDSSRNEKFQLTWYGALISSYGNRYRSVHQGVDIHLKTGDTVVSAFDGIVRYAEFNRGGYGNCVVIRHLNGLETLYGHLSKISVGKNQFVKAGELVGLGGSTGRSYGPHLHFETRYKGHSFDPFVFIDADTKTLKSDSLLIIKDQLVKHKFISKDLGVTASTDQKSDSITIQQTRKVKKSKNKSTTKSKYHTVKQGENVSVIAKKYGITWVKLRQLNNLSANVVLQPGTKLRVK